MVCEHLFLLRYNIPAIDWVMVKVFNATFNNISAKSWWSATDWIRSLTPRRT